LEQSEEYKHLKLLERVSLFDTVNVEFPALNLSATAKVVKLVYDGLADRVKSVTLGSVRANIADTIANQQQEIQKVPTKTDLERAKESATAWLTNGNGYAYFRKDDLGNVVDILFMDTQDAETAVNVMRVGQSGIGFSHNGVNGPYESAWTIDGNFVADFITTGNLSASLIKTGTLDASAINVINLIAEKLQSASGESVVDISGAVLSAKYGGLETIMLSNQYAPHPIMYMHDYKDGEIKNSSEFSPHSIKIGGTSLNPVISFFASENEASMSISGSGTKVISWKDNGDGTFTLIGQ
jgi:hypothetical protein